MFWHKRLGSMKAFVNDETMWEVPVLNFMRQRNPFMLLKKGVWGPSLDLSIGQQVLAASKAGEAPTILKQRETREGPDNSSCKVKREEEGSLIDETQ